MINNASLQLKVVELKKKFDQKMLPDQVFLGSNMYMYYR
jgi:hypothetical protein